MTSGGAALVQCFQATVQGQPAAIKSAEATLKQMSRQPGHAIEVLKIVDQQHLPVAERLSAAVYFKNTIKHSWAPDAESEVDIVNIQPAEREEIKTFIVSLMLRLEPALRSQISEALTIISLTDFPGNWQGLLPELVAKLNTSDVSVIVGVFETIASVFKRFRTSYIDEPGVNSALDYCQKTAAGPVLEMVTNMQAATATVAGDKDALKRVCAAVRLGNEIVHSLNIFGLSDTMEQQMEGWMKSWKFWLEFSSPVLKESDAEAEAADDAVKAAVCENCNLFLQHCEEEIAPYLETFVGAAWRLLIGCSTATAQDNLAMTAIAFLTSVCNTVHFKVFGAADTLKQICEGIIIPNVRFRAEDEEAFESNYVEYIRRDYEGSDSDTRRRAASDFVRHLADKFPEQTTAIFSTYINALLGEYAAGPDAQWAAKDCAMYLVMALAVKGKTAALGATTVNALVDVTQFFQQHVLPELGTAELDVRPVLKADALRFVTLFRSTLSKALLLEAFPQVVRLLGAESNVVHSYAAICIERLLALKIGGAPLFAPPDVASQLQHLLTLLFSAFEKDDSGENEYLMKCVMRIISFVGPQIIPVASVCLDRLTAMLLAVCKNPLFAGFNHYIFESVAALVSNTKQDAVVLKSLEEKIFPCFDIVLQHDVQEFHPYVFQIFALLLSSHKDPGPVYVDVMLAPFLRHEFWERRGNIPALTLLLQAYLERAADAIVAKGFLQGVLGIFQKLLSLSRHLREAYALLGAALRHVPLPALQPYLPQIFTLLFGKLTGQGKSPKNTAFFITAVGRGVCAHGPGPVLAAMDAVQPGCSITVVQQVVCNNLANVADAEDVRIMAVALARILCEHAPMLQSPAWPAVLTELVRFLETEKAAPIEAGEEMKESLEEMMAYSNEFSQLQNARLPSSPMLPEVTDVRKYVAQALAALSQKQPGQLAQMISGTPPEVQAKIGEYMQAAGVALQ